ncbi:MAG: S-layer homology domain-containing protein [Oscillospiraceae bacterium]|jgi:hypothetical protein|nr:S-layer homology domain-containing protein [Oscillospiraceae bacterium]
MNKPTARRFLSLLLALLLLLSLSPAALAAPSGGDGGDPPESTGPDDPDTDTPEKPEKIEISLKAVGTSIDGGKLTMDPGKGPMITASILPEANKNDKITWSTTCQNTVARVDYDNAGNGHTMYPYGLAPGVSTIIGRTDTGGEVKLDVTVSGMVVKSDEVTIKQNQRLNLKEWAEGMSDSDFWVRYYGSAADSAATVSISSDKNNVVRVTGTSRGSLLIDGVAEGKATVTVKVMQGTQTIAEKKISVTVESNQAEPIKGTASASDPLRFSTLESQIAAQCRQMIQGDDNSLSHITGLSVPTSQGTLYVGWQSAENTGMGVGSSLRYYVSSAARGPYISDVVFVPNPDYTGEKATINFTGVSAGGRTYKGRIEVTLKEASTDLTITTKRATPVKLAGALFNEACQRETGAPLEYVIFTLPPASQGALYSGYKSELDYTAKVTANDQYSLAALDTLTFVPNEDFVGTVNIRYFGYNVSGSRYAGELVVKVEQGLDDSIVYHDNGSGRVTFQAYDFTSFCRNATGGDFAYVSFTPPPASQGTLTHYGWPLTSDQQVYAPGAVTFAAAQGFNGVVRIPFVGYDRTGRQYKGTVQIHVQSTGESDLAYYCAPGSSVKLVAADFNSLCMAQTGERLHYIAFQSLPDHNMGALYHNRTSSGGLGTRAKKDTKYFQGAVPYLSNLSFWATEKFTGTLEIPFTGSSISGKTFTGLLTIRSGSGSGAGSSSGVGTNGVTVSYSTTGREHVLFNAKDFDSACRSATNSALSYVQFNLPSSGQGILYFDYHTTEAPTAVSSSTSYYLSGEESISKVSFHPAYGASGVVQIPFSGAAIDGSDLQGVVSINVRAAGSSGTTVRYTTFGTPVKLSASDFFYAAGTNQPVSVRLDGLPAASAGKMYYQYVSPTQYSWQANTTTEYSLNNDPLVSNLTFIPKAGYVGMVSIPYAATNGDGTQYSGEIRITVNTPTSSSQFDDLAGFNAQTLAAVNFLYDRGVVNGMGNSKYGPGLSIRRGDFCLMLCRAFRFESVGSAMPFSDVPGNAYYANAVNTLSSMGVVNGTGSNRFQPDSPISRQDASLMIQRTLKTAGISAENGSAEDIASYPDAASVASYAQGAVSGLARLGLIPTAGDGRLAPADPLTRADMAVLLHRAMTQ